MLSLATEVIAEEAKSARINQSEERVKFAKATKGTSQGHWSRHNGTLHSKMKIKQITHDVL